MRLRFRLSILICCEESFGKHDETSYVAKFRESPKRKLALNAFERNQQELTPITHRPHLSCPPPLYHPRRPSSPSSPPSPCPNSIGRVHAETCGNKTMACRTGLTINSPRLEMLARWKQAPEGGRKLSMPFSTTEFRADSKLVNDSIRRSQSTILPISVDNFAVKWPLARTPLDNPFLFRDRSSSETTS